MSSLQLNRRKPIRLPFSTALKPTHLNQVEQTDCGICRQNKSKYVCPRCNIFYCSLDCFRSTQHVQCSEPFYAASIRESIAQNPSSSEEEKRGMFKILERFERGGDDVEQQLGDTDGEVSGTAGNGIGAGKLEDLYRRLIGEGGDAEDENDDEEDDEAREELAQRLEGVDLDSLAPQDLFALLPASHRKKFVGLLQSEASRARLVQDVEDDEDEDEDEDGGRIQGEASSWWAPTGVTLRLEEEPQDHETDDDRIAESVTNVERPQLLDEVDLGKIAVPQSVVESLRFNLMTICLAYVVTVKTFLPRTRTFQYLLQSEAGDRKRRKIDRIKTLLRGSAGFLFDPRSTWKATGMRDAEDAVYGGVDLDRESLDFVQDLSDLIRPPLDLAEPHASRLVISDLYALFSSSSHGSSKDKQVLKKLGFYYVLAGQIGWNGWLDLERIVMSRIEQLQVEDGRKEEANEKEEALLIDDVAPVRRVGDGSIPDTTKHSKIVEI